MRDSRLPRRLAEKLVDLEQGLDVVRHERDRDDEHLLFPLAAELRESRRRSRARATRRGRAWIGTRASFGSRPAEQPRIAAQRLARFRFGYGSPSFVTSFFGIEWAEKARAWTPGVAVGKLRDLLLDLPSACARRKSPARPGKIRARGSAAPGANRRRTAAAALEGALRRRQRILRVERKREEPGARPPAPARRTTSSTSGREQVIAVRTSDVPARLAQEGSRRLGDLLVRQAPDRGAAADLCVQLPGGFRRGRGRSTPAMAFAQGRRLTRMTSGSEKRRYRKPRDVRKCLRTPELEEEDRARFTACARTSAFRPCRPPREVRVERHGEVAKEDAAERASRGSRRPTARRARLRAQGGEPSIAPAKISSNADAELRPRSPA